MIQSCIISEIKRDIDRKSGFFIPPTFDAPVRGPSRNIAIPFGTEKLKRCGYPVVKKFEDTFSRFYRIPACDGQTD